MLAWLWGLQLDHEYDQRECALPALLAPTRVGDERGSGQAVQRDPARHLGEQAGESALRHGQATGVAGVLGAEQGAGQRGALPLQPVPRPVAGFLEVHAVDVVVTALAQDRPASGQS
jgi:hypothetical protein